MYLPPDQLEMLDPLARWLYETGGHLDSIAAGSNVVIRHVEQMKTRPAFDTRAEDMMRRAEEVLQHALSEVRLARAIYRDKEIEP